MSSAKARANAGLNFDIYEDPTESLLILIFFKQALSTPVQEPIINNPPQITTF